MVALTIPEALGPVVWAVLGLFGGLGFLAVVSPRLFSALSSAGNRWIDTTQAVAKLDRRFDVDTRVMPYLRWLGAAVLASVLLLGFVLAR